MELKLYIYLNIISSFYSYLLMVFKIDCNIPITYERYVIVCCFSYFISYLIYAIKKKKRKKKEKENTIGDKCLIP